MASSSQVEKGYEGMEPVTALTTEHFERFELATTGRFERLEQRLERVEQRVEHFEVVLERRLGDVRVEMLKWSFLFWVGQVAAFGGMLAFALRR